MYTQQVFNAEAVGLGASVESAVIDINAYAEEGFFSLQVEVTGTGTAKFEYMISNNGADYITQTAAADVIVADFVATSGPGSDGKDIISFEPEPAAKMKIKVTETGGATAIAVTATIVVA